MAMHVALNHKTQYLYDRTVNLGPHVIRLRPAVHSRVRILSYSLNIEPEKHFINWQQDPQGNYLARLVFPEPTDRLLLEVDLVAEMAIFNPFDFFLEPAAENFPFDYEPELARDLKPYLETEPVGPELAGFLRNVPRKSVRTIDFLVDLNHRMQKRVGYVIRMEPGIQTCEETLSLGTGSCRDSAWLMVQALRNLGLAARFVSGYLIQLTADVKPLEGPAGPAADFTDLHAWAEVYLPGAGWVGLDPTSGMFAGEGHIPLACTPDPAAAAPISGQLDPCESDFRYEMKVTRIVETPRVTKPYTEEQWSGILALGEKVEADLTAGDVRLTMGGEPTFVSIDDPDGPEWNQLAMGPKKRELAANLFLRMRDHFAPGALLHFGQGKWYPGELLPRWALGCYWRKDGIPIWRDKSLIADDTRDYEFTTRHAREFIGALTRRLEVDARYIMPGYEDVFYYLWRERKLPVNVDPLDSKLKDPVERERLARVFEQGVGEAIGYVLPLRRMTFETQREWSSQPWFVRPKQLFLIPGDSPMGYRLPLDALPWTQPIDVEWNFEPDPFAPREALPPPADPGDLVTTGGPRQPVEEMAPPRKGHSSRWVSRPALCVEAREGKIFIFMPPVETLADYFDLIAAIEDTCAHTGMPAAIEGYTPPDDPRVRVFKVTPDPGVIEVNVHPAGTWSELVANVTDVYQLARQSRLGTEKFLMDGKPSGTGGGNHVVLGAAAPEDSPFLRRPDLLRSMIAYWQNHPSLSYLFSGLFIGPTSQHPRVDEARMDSLYELEIAFGQVPEPGSENVPWQVDRIFRNLLVDLTGNTHRAEICIDKLYPAESASSRLGLVELRAFEMPPHSRMSLTQQLLVRALVAWFWREPYRRPLVKWGTALHDRYMLPHFIRLDWEDVLRDLLGAGYEFDGLWFEPHLEFRFPAIGSITHRGIHLELRHALEPWHVLGEEPSGGGAVRNVDSSVERLQVSISGWIDPRYAVTCNGSRLPLYPTETNGEFVAGVRYRAWQPPSCLHPMIPVHTPLVFDIVDTWTGRSIGGCRYDASHPGGRAMEKFPVNANDAESRRLARFSPTGHTPGPVDVAGEHWSPEFPVTLDLRRESGLLK
jgi:uncharacterized protein (DUF2126 family)